MSPWRAVTLIPLFLFSLYLGALGLLLGGWTIQWFAAYVLVFGPLILLGMVGGAVYAVTRGQPMRPWLTRYLGAFVVMVIAVVVSWMVTDAVWKP